MVHRFLRLGAVTSLVALMATSGNADDQAIPQGAILTPAQIAHVFDAACIASVPALMERRAAIVETVFFFEQIDLGTDAGWISTDGAITLTVDGNPIEATCAMSIVADLAGDGAELYESLEAHLSDHLDGTLPEADYIDGGVIWTWDGSNAAFTLRYFEVEGAFGLDLTAEG